MHGRIWVSIDPLRKEVNIYPRWVSNKIEEQINIMKYETDPYKTIELGSDFYNATLHLKPNENYYQTTPGCFYNRGGGKEPGYRKFLPINVIDGKYNIYANFVSQQWRICKYAYESTDVFNGTLENSNDLIPFNYTDVNEDISIEPWNTEDMLPTSDGNKIVTVWMWCRGVKERQGNVFQLTDSWWSPYFCEDNKKIDEAFNSKKQSVEITLFNNTQRNIEFSSDFSCYAKQIKYRTPDDNTYAIRMVKKVTMSVNQLKEKMNNLNKIIIDPSIVTTLMEDDYIPNEFYCSISQDIMTDPVKTVDNHTYDRLSIEKWFEHRVTSPLTGLELESITLVPNDELREQIQNFVRIQIEKSQLSNVNSSFVSENTNENTIEQ